MFNYNKSYSTTTNKYWNKS